MSHLRILELHLRALEAVAQERAVKKQAEATRDEVHLGALKAEKHPADLRLRRAHSEGMQEVGVQQRSLKKQAEKHRQRFYVAASSSLCSC